MRQVAVQRTHIGVNRHIVVVEDYKQVVGGVGGIVDAFEGQTAAYRGVAYHGHHVAARMLVVEHCGHSHAESCRNGVGGMSGGKCVVGAFVRVGEAREAAECAVGGEAVAPSGEQFVAVGLMPHIPHDAVVGGAEHIVQRNGNLNRSHRRCEMSRIVAERVDEEIADFRAHLRQLVHLQPAQVGRRVDGGEQGCGSLQIAVIVCLVFRHCGCISCIKG